MTTYRPTEKMANHITELRERLIAKREEGANPFAEQSVAMSNLDLGVLVYALSAALVTMPSLAAEERKGP